MIEEQDTNSMEETTNAPTDALKKTLLAVTLMDNSSSRKKTTRQARMPEGTSAQGEGTVEKKEDVGVSKTPATVKNGATTMAKWAAIGTGVSFFGILYSSGSSDASAEILAVPSHSLPFISKIIGILF